MTDQTPEPLTPDEAKRIRVALIFGDPALALESKPDPKLEVAKAKLKAIEKADLGEELELIREFCEVAENIRGHYGIEECAGVGGPATEWDELQDALARLARDGREFLSAKQGEGRA